MAKSSLLRDARHHDGKPLKNIKRGMRPNCIHFRTYTYIDNNGTHTQHYCNITGRTTLEGEVNYCSTLRREGTCERMIK